MNRLDRKVWIAFRAALVVAVALASAPTYAGDVSMTLDSGAGFTVKDSTGAIERLRVDEATGNVSRNGALFVHTTGTGSTFVGVNAGSGATVGYRNSAFGSGALRTNTAGNTSSAFGYRALYSNTTGFRNTAVGADALRSNANGFDNTAVGTYALRSNVSGRENAAAGNFALALNTTGSNNTAVGTEALYWSTTASYNSAVGNRALFSNTTGTGNSAVGRQALASNTTSASNSAFGDRALTNATGESNTAVGFWALRDTTTGTFNVAVGQRAGLFQTTGTNNIYLANVGVAAESNTIRIGIPGAGTPGTHSRAFIAGIRGITTNNADAVPVVIDSAGQLGTVSSSRSVKKDIHDMGDATARLLDLRPVTFGYKQEQTLPGGREVPPEYGLVAEEVAEVFPDLVVYDDKGAPFTVKYHELAPMLLNEMKKDRRSNVDQQHEIDEQAAVIETQRREIAALTARLARIETQVSSASH